MCSQTCPGRSISMTQACLSMHLEIELYKGSKPEGRTVVEKSISMLQADIFLSLVSWCSLVPCEA